jgi:high-affinity nickel-transport protein
VLLYKPWRRRIDKKRAQRAHFVPLPQSSDGQGTATTFEDGMDAPTQQTKDGSKVNTAPIEATDAAGPVGGPVERRRSLYD